MKTITAISLDTELKTEAKLHINNLSGEIEQFLRVRLAQIKGNTNEFSKLEIENKLKKLSEINIKTQSEMKTLNDKLTLINEQIENERTQALHIEKEKAEAVLKCVLCGGLIEGHKKEIAYTKDDVDFYHHTNCFMDKLETHKWKTKDDYVEWLEKNRG